MANVVTLYVDNTSLRLLVTKGKRVEKWAHLLLEPGLVSDGVIADEAEVASRIQELFKAQGVKTTKVVIGLSGLHCLTRIITLPQLPKALLAEAITREAERVVPVPLEQLYLSWQILPASGEEIHVFLVALPRNAADALIKTLHQAGLEPYLMDLKPFALARVVNKPTAIIVDVQPTELDIVVMVDGVPQSVRSLSLPSRALTLSEKLPTIKEELERTINFHNSSYSENPLEMDTPIFVSGELAEDPEALQSLAQEQGYPVMPLLSPLECPESLAPSHYMVNIGLALKEISLPKGEANFSVVDLNALPEAYKPKPFPFVKILIAPSIIILAIAALFPLVTLLQSAGAETASLNSQLVNVNRLIERGKAQKQEISGLEEQVVEVEASRDTFTAVVDVIEDQKYVVDGDLEVTASALPDTVEWTFISHFNRELTISGEAPTEVEALAYARELRTSGRFSQVTVSHMKRTDDGMSFTLTLLDEETGSISTPVEEVQD